MSEEVKKDIVGTKCPFCLRSPSTSYCINIEEDSKVLWYQCKCGSVYRTERIDKKIFNEDYKNRMLTCKDIKDRIEYFFRVYTPLVEDLT